MKIKKILMTSWLILGLAVLTKAQQTQLKNTVDTSAVSRLSQQLGIDKEKAANLKAALNYRQEEIQRMIQDKTMAPVNKSRQLTLLLTERKNRIDAVGLTSEQKNIIKQQQANVLQLARDRHEQIRQQNEASVGKLAVKNTDMGNNDSLQNAGKPQ